MIELHTPDQNPDSPGTVLVLAGGGYHDRAEHESVDVSRFLAEHGVRAAWLDYPVAPARYPQALHLVLRAVAELRSHGPVAVLGFSAGGHLAGTAATATADELAAAGGLARPDAAVLCYPVVSMVDHPHLGSRMNLLGTEEDAPARALSVELRVDADTPPVFAWHTADDAHVGVEHSLALTAALRRHQVPVELHVYPHGRHGLGLADGLIDWTTPLLRWLGEQGIA
jgi:acetyl esterase/lipase